MEPGRVTIPYLLDGAFHGMAVHTWGDPGAPPVVCVHGLTRSGRDFDALAQGLSGDHFVLCPDLPGRGASDWLARGAQYQPLSYVQALSHLLAWVGRPVGWVGTSLGGICGMLLAAAARAPIARMVLNDIGPEVPAEALRRIQAYMVMEFSFPDLAALEQHLRVIHRPFGALSDAQWHHLALHSSRALPEGGVALHYDPAMAEPYRGAPMEALDLWAVWAAINRERLPILAVRGEESDILPPSVFDRMVADGATPLVVAGAGHAPALMDAESIAAIRGFLA